VKVVYFATLGAAFTNIAKYSMKPKQLLFMVALITIILDAKLL
jgi:hypothetical protein